MPDASPTFSGSGSQRRRRWLHYLAGAIGAALILTGLSQAYNRYSATHASQLAWGPATNRGEQDAQPEGKPSETKPEADAAARYAVPADQPRSIRIESVGISGLVQAVSTTKTRAMAAPSNIYVAGWYSGSVKPGEPGLAILDGHMTGRYADGIFKRLHEVQPGAVIVIELGNKVVKTFKVVDQTTLPDEQAAAYLFKKRADIPIQLNIITCGGEYNRTTGRYADRVIVVAQAVSE